MLYNNLLSELVMAIKYLEMNMQHFTNDFLSKEKCSLIDNVCIMNNSYFSKL